MSGQEEWREAAGYPDYLVTNTGRVASLKTGDFHEMSPVIVGGYRRVNLSNEDGRKLVAIHRLVALTFIGPCPSGQEVRHMDGDRLNNNLDNLQFGTRAENVRDMLGHGTHPQASKSHCKRGHEFTPENTYAKSSGGRQCRACNRVRSRDYKIRQQLAAANVKTTGAAA